MTTVIKNLKWGLRWGLIVAGAFTGIAIFVTLTAGPDSKGISLESLIGVYLLGGVTGGLLLGALRPLTSRKAGAIFVGTLVAAALLSMIEYLFIVKDHWNSVDTYLVVLLSLVTGPVGTLMIWEGRAQMRARKPDEH